MAVNENANVNVNVNGEAAEDQLTVLQQQAKKFRVEMEKANKAGDIKGFQNAEREFKAVNKQARQLAKNTFDVQQVLKNLSGAGPKELSRSFQELNRAINSGEIKRGSAEWKTYTNNLKLVRAEQNRVAAEMRATTPFITRMADGFNKYFSIITSGILTLTGMVYSFRKAIDSFNEYEKKIDRLSALTGLAGENLEWLSDQAKEMSTSMVEGGVRITQSADMIVDAFTKVGSARPELLKDKEALREVTEEAIILSEAAGSELQPAVEALTMVMNQYNVQASEARRIINSLAAGSKVGAGEIPYLTTGFEKAGTVAADAGISIEELIGIIETLAPRISQPEIAGRSLKGVILDLQKTADDTNPAIVGFSQAIENLGKKNLSTVELTKMFGDENITVAKILLNNTGEMNKYTEAVTGTNVAIEQAIINTDNNSSRLEQSKNKVKLLSIELGERLAPALTFSTTSFSYLMKATIAVIKFFDEYGAAVISGTAGIIAYTIAVNASTIAFKAHYYWIVLTEKVTKLFNQTWKTNPLGLVIGLVMTLVTSLGFLASRTREVTEEQKKLNEALEEGNKIMENSRSLDERAKLLDQMSKSGLERFKSDAEQQLQEIDKLDEKRLLASKQYEQEVIKLEQTISQVTKNESEQKALYQNKYFTAERDKAFAHFQDMTNMVKNANAEQLKSYIALAEEKIKLTGGGGGSDMFATTIKGLKDELTKLREERENLNIADTQALINNAAQIEIIQNLIKAYESLDGAITKIKPKSAKKGVSVGNYDMGPQSEDEKISGFPTEIQARDNAEKILEIANNTSLSEQEVLLEMLDNNLIGYEAYFTAINDLYKSDAETHKQYVQDKLNEARAYLDTANTLTQSMVNFNTAAMNKELKAAGNNEAKKESIKKEYAKKNQDYAILQARINGALAIMNIWAGTITGNPVIDTIIKAVLTAAQIIFTESQVADIKSATYAKGRYPTLGADGKMYYPDQVISKPTTGVVKGPALVSELQDEMIIDGPTTRRLAFENPEILNGIIAMSKGFTPQFADGRYPTSTKEIIRENRSEMFTDPALSSMLIELREQLQKGFKVVTTEDNLETWNKAQTDLSSFKSNVNAG